MSWPALQGRSVAISSDRTRESNALTEFERDRDSWIPREPGPFCMFPEKNNAEEEELPDGDDFVPVDDDYDYCLRSPYHDRPFRLRGHKGCVAALAWAPERAQVGGTAPLLASASADQSFAIWQLDESGEDFQCIFSQSKQKGGLNDASWSSDGSRIVVASDDKTLKVWDLEYQKVQSALRSHNGPVMTVRFMDWSGGNGAKELVVSGGFDGDIRFWDSRSAKPLIRQLSHQEPVSAIAIHPSGQDVVSADITGRVFAINVAEALRSAYRHAETPFDSSTDAPLRSTIINPEQSEMRIARLDHRNEAITTLEYSLNGHWLLVYATDGQADVICTGSCHAVSTIQTLNTRHLQHRACIVSPPDDDGLWLALPRENGSVMVADASSGYTVDMLQPGIEDGHQMAFLAAAADSSGRFIAAGANNAEDKEKCDIYIWSTAHFS